MTWITKIHSGRSGLLATVRGPGQQARTVRLGDLDALDIKSVCASRQGSYVWRTSEASTIDFQDFRNEAWARSIETTPAQTFYVAPFMQHWAIFSTQDLVRAIFGLNATLWDCLFSPRDPGTIRPTGGAKGASVLDWVNRFPSARRAWSSVYAEALDNHLQFELPSARIELRFRFDPTYSRFVMAEHISAVAVTALEPAIGSASSGETTIFDFGPSGSNAMVVPGLSRRDGTWGCTDAEWDGILDLGGRRLWRRKDLDSLRAAIDTILERYGTGKSWRSVQRNDVPFWRTDQYRYRLQKMELLDPIIRAIQISRSG